MPVLRGAGRAKKGEVVDAERPVRGDFVAVSREWSRLCGPGPAMGGHLRDQSAGGRRVGVRANVLFDLCQRPTVGVVFGEGCLRLLEPVRGLVWMAPDLSFEMGGGGGGGASASNPARGLEGDQMRWEGDRRRVEGIRRRLEDYPRQLEDNNRRRLPGNRRRVDSNESGPWGRSFIKKNKYGRP